MKRRGFIGLFAGALSAATLDLERALWIPGAKKISIPKPARIPTTTLSVFDKEANRWNEIGEVEGLSFVPSMKMSDVLNNMAATTGFAWGVDGDNTITFTVKHPVKAESAVFSSWK